MYPRALNVATAPVIAIFSPITPDILEYKAMKISVQLIGKDVTTAGTQYGLLDNGIKTALKVVSARYSTGVYSW